MAHPALPIAVLALAAPAAAALDNPRPVGRAEVTQLTIHERIIIRVPRMGPAQSVSRVMTVTSKPVSWKEKKGPKCIAADSMAGAMITTARQVDLVLKGGKRVRAKLDGDCRPLDFYSGFYLRPAGDGMICADRDSIRVRSGASCDIDEFRRLVAAR